MNITRKWLYHSQQADRKHVSSHINKFPAPSKYKFKNVASINLEKQVTIQPFALRDTKFVCRFDHIYLHTDFAFLLLVNKTDLLYMYMHSGLLMDNTCS